MIYPATQNGEKKSLLLFCLNKSIQLFLVNTLFKKNLYKEYSYNLLPNLLKLFLKNQKDFNIIIRM